MTRAKVDLVHAEMCLGHTLKGVKGTYDCHNYQDEMRAAYETLAQQIELIVNPPPDEPAGDNVVRLQERRA